jgi:hypothetical protein
VVEQLVLWGQLHGDAELLKQLCPAALPFILLLEVAQEKPGHDAHEDAEDGDLGGQRGEHGDERHRQGADNGGSHEAEAQQDRAPGFVAVG